MKLYIYFCLVYLFTIFFPSFHSLLGNLGAILIIGSSGAFVGFYFLITNKTKIVFGHSYEPYYFKFFLLIFCFFALHITLAMSIGVAFGNIDLIVRDFFEFHRPFYYSLVFIFSFFVFKNYSSINWFENFLLVVFFILVGFGFFQFFDVSREISGLYTKELNLRSGRVAIPFGNPYFFSFFVSFFVLFFFIKFIFFSKKYVFLFLLSVIMFILPQSRSVAAGLLIGFFVLLPFLMLYLNFQKVLKLKLDKKFAKFLLFFASLIFLSVLFISSLIESFPYLTGQFVKFFNGEGAGSSANVRLDQFLFAIDKASNNGFIWVFGNGPAKNEMEYVESIYTYQFYRYGIVGIVLYFIFPLLVCAWLSWRCMTLVGFKSQDFSIYFALFLWFLTIPLMSIGNNFTEQVRLSFFFYTFVGFINARYVLLTAHS